MRVPDRFERVTVRWRYVDGQEPRVATYVRALHSDDAGAARAFADGEPDDVRAARRLYADACETGTARLLSPPAAERLPVLPAQAVAV